MAVQTSYPGVYVQEVPSGVRTITGVSTSIAAFIGRSRQGPLYTPVSCLSFSDFERTFSADDVGSDLARSVRLFFLNGGTQSYVMRIADNSAASSSVNLNAGGADLLTIRAKSAGLIGDSIRFSINYNTPNPESTFNLELFRWTTNNAGVQVKTEQELWQGLSMDPASPKYIATYVTQNSKLIDVAALPAAIPGAGTVGFSESGRALRSADADFRTDLGNALAIGRNFRISVGRNAFVNVDLTSIDLTTAPLNTANPATIIAAIETVINGLLPAGAAVALSNTPDAGGTLFRIRISSVGPDDVRIEPSTTNDLARALMLGTAQGGLEVSRFAGVRPIPNGMVFDSIDLVAFGQLTQGDFDTISVNGTAIAFNTELQTVGAAALMREDNNVVSVTDNNEGIREKWAIIANRINAAQSTIPNFRWSGQLWGSSRLAVVPGDGSDNSAGTITSSGGAGTDIGPMFTPNVRYYSLGTSGTGAFQSGGVAGNDGNAPTLQNYRDAFVVIDREVNLFNLMILPHDSGHDAATTASLWGPASVFCQERRAFLLMDPPDTWTSVDTATHASTGVNSLRIGLVKDHSAIFFPRITIRENALNVQVAASGAMAGLMARIDGSRGVWKAPAGTEADLRGISGIEYRFTDGQNGVLNQRGVNTIRNFPNGIVSWGARTMDGDDDFASEWKYIPVRRTALFIEESLYRGLKWVVFEPNDEPLWAQIRLNVGAFMHDLFRQGAFQGQKKDDAYFVKCDKETTTQNDINLGRVNIWVGFAPLKPAEFVILYLQQMTGQIQV